MEGPFLQELDQTQWQHTGMPVTTLIREWSDGSVDALVVLSPDIAYGRRDNSSKRLVEQKSGKAVEVARFMQRLPAPGTPGAPSDELPDPIEPVK